MTQAGCFTTIYGPGVDDEDDVVQNWSEGDDVPWVVSAPLAIQMVNKANATLLDVRSDQQRAIYPFKSARVITWQMFSSDQSPNQGELLMDNDMLSQKLESVGVRQNHPVVVIGSPIEGWGEDGRIVWMLRTLGHEKVALVDGGAQALSAKWQPSDHDAVYDGAGDFKVSRTASWSIDTNGVKAHMTDKTAQLIDTRERQEYDGNTPYGETRGGHVPGATHLYYKALLDERGRLLSRDVLLEKLTSLGLEQDKPVVAYCTGGVRSGWFVAVLVWLGFTQVTNYAGSMWQWSSLPAMDYPLESSSK